MGDYCADEGQADEEDQAEADEEDQASVENQATVQDQASVEDAAGNQVDLVIAAAIGLVAAAALTWLYIF